jgi:hypothetical protein
MNLNLPFSVTSWPSVCNYDIDIVLVYAIFKYALLHLRQLFLNVYLSKPTFIASLINEIRTVLS